MKLAIVETARRCRRGQQSRHDALDDLARVEIDDFEDQLAGFDLREVENVVDDREQVVAVALDRSA